ncbi:MAG TPA: GNAT family N-acetyltransferase [Gaiellaceae bacterium]|nr:GNAT family N-acetyltransferase [Gaiellaceae bacterium]
MALRLRPLREGELPAFLERVRAEYLRQLVAEAGMTPAQAEAKRDRDLSRLLPGGEVPAGNHLRLIEDGDSGERVGDLWWAERENDAGEPAAFVYSVEIAPELRGRGFGKEAMLLFEGEAGGRGLRELGLTVLGGNDVARSLYRSIGYRERAVFMSKTR